MDVYDWDRFGSNDFMGRAYLHAKEIIGTRGRGQISKSYTLGPKHAHGGGGMFDKLRGFTGEFPGEVTVCWTCSPAR